MLILSRKRGERIVIDGSITVEVVAVRNGHVKLGIAAPPEVVVDREEIHDERTRYADADSYSPDAEDDRPC